MAAPTSNQKSNTLFVGTVPYNATDADLESFFSAVGPIRSCFVVKEKDEQSLRGGKDLGKLNKGYGFVRFALHQDAERALKELKKVKFNGQRTLRMAYALPKSNYKSKNLNNKDQSDRDDLKYSDVEDDSEELEMQMKEEMSDDSEQEGHGDNRTKKIEIEPKDAEDIFSNLESDSINEEKLNESESSQEFNDYEEEDEEEEDEEEEDEEEEDEKEEEEIVIDKPLKPKKKLPSASEGSTLFIRNLAFEATQEELSELFSKFGPLRYCLVTKDHETGRSRGTGFVCFKELHHANLCLLEAEKVNNNNNMSEPIKQPKKPGQQRNEVQYKSILMADPSDSLAAPFTLHGRVLSVARAVEREQAKQLMDQNQVRIRLEDRRNFYLLKEGAILPDTPASALLPAAEVNKRTTSYSNRKSQLAKNPNLYISKTRISVRNLPITVDEKKLKELGRESIQKFKEQVKKGERQALSKVEGMEGWDHKPFIKQAKIVRSKDRIDSTTQKPRSKGYGFLEFTHHAHALAALRYLNNNPDLFGDKKRLIVEFSIENNLIVKRRMERKKNTGSVQNMVVEAEHRPNKNEPRNDKNRKKKLLGEQGKFVKKRKIEEISGKKKTSTQDGKKFHRTGETSKNKKK
ncbi:hypothetical protein G9A89_010557 [Geosiphon pyriformis]|nr:hypothetical protein G9A89_010557 [Geosiphon pyriformis]